MKCARLLLAGGVLLASGMIVSAQPTPRPNVVVVRDNNNILSVSTLVAGPRDTLSIVNGRVIVNGRATGMQIDDTPAWGPQVLGPDMYFVAGDPASLRNDRGWGVVPRDRILGTVILGVVPATR